MSRRVIIRIMVFLGFVLLALALPIGARGEEGEAQVIDRVDLEVRAR